MAVLARSEGKALEQLWEAWAEKPVFTWLRKPETGLVMVRGRVGGEGSPFNLGEMTVTRCALQLGDGTVGHACTQGRSHRKAEVAALVDALHQKEESAARLRSEILQPLDEARTARNARRAGETAATQVQFFTRVRGDD